MLLTSDRSAAGDRIAAIPPHGTNTSNINNYLEELQKAQPLLVSKKVQQYTSNLYGSTPPFVSLGLPGF